MRVLIAEDEEYLQRLYFEIFEMKGHKVVGQAYNGEEAVELFRGLDPAPDCVLMDHRMPGADGITATIKIRELDPQVRIIFASADVGIMEEAIEAGAEAFLAKPFSVQELVQALEEPLQVVYVYLASNNGLPMASYQTEETSLDPDLFTSMLSAIDDFVSHSLGSLAPTRHHLSRMDYGPWSIGIHLASHFRLILVYSGFADQMLQSILERTVKDIEFRYGRVMVKWDGNRRDLAGIEGLLERLTS